MGRYRTLAPLALAAVMAALLIAMVLVRFAAPRFVVPLPAHLPSSDLSPIPDPRTRAERIVNGAKAEARRGVRYDPSYVRVPYSGGDVPADQGACTDVVVRALRNAGYDLQRLIYEDKRRNPAPYRRYPGQRGPDHNIDHRRVPNHIAFLRRHGTALPTSTSGRAAACWRPGDLVYWKLPSGQDHCGVLSNVRNAEGLPLVIHNLGVATQEDCLTTFRIVGHFQYPPGP